MLGSGLRWIFVPLSNQNYSCYPLALPTASEDVSLPLPPRDPCRQNVPFGGCMQNPEVLVQYLHVLKVPPPACLLRALSCLPRSATLAAV